MTLGTSQLVLRVSAPTAIEQFKAMTAGARELASALADLKRAGAGGSGSSSTARLQAELKEVKAALQANQLQTETLQRAYDEQSKRNVANIARESTAIREKNRVEREEVRKTAQARKEAEDGTSWLHKTQLRSAVMTGSLNIRSADEIRKAQARGAALNAEGNRQIEYQQIKHNEARQQLNLMGERALEMQRRAAQARSAALNADGQRQIELQETKHQARLQETNLAGQRAIDVQQRAAVAARLARMHSDPRLILGSGAAAGSAAASAAAFSAGFSQPAQLSALYRLHNDNAGAATTHAGATKALREQQMLLHTAARGTAGALGGLWLTYAKHIPLMLATFGAVSTIRESLKRGAEYDYTLGFTAALSDEAPRMGRARYKEQIDTGLRAVAKDAGLFSASELATGLRVLEQTGIDASKGVNLIATAAYAAVQGEVTLKTATEDLVSVLEVFKLRTDDPIQLQKNFQRVGDVMSTVAKETKANLHDVAESLKNTTGLVSQYQVRLETAAAVVLQLGRAGIVSNKAGTFTRNMFENLYSSKSGSAVAVKKELGLTPFDSSGQFKNDVAFLTEALEKINKLDPESKLAAVRAIFNERGSRPARELLVQQAQALDGLAQSVAKLDNSKGALHEFAKALDGVAKVEWQKVAKRWDDALTGAFAGAEGQLVSLAKQLQDAFTNDKVLRGLTALISGVGTLAKLSGMVAQGWGMIAGGVVDTKQRAEYDGLKARLANIDKAEAAYGADRHTSSARAALAGRLAAHPLRHLESQQLVAAQQAAGLYDKGQADRELARVDPARGIAIRHASAGGNQRLPNALLDPAGERGRVTAERRKNQLEQAQAAEADAELRRHRALSERLARNELSALEQRHRLGLASEEQYSAGVEAINRQRLNDEVEATRVGILKMQADRAEIKGPDAGPKQQAIQTRINDAVFKLQELNLQAIAAEDKAVRTIAGIEKKAQDALRKTGLDSAKIIEKSVKEEELLRERQALEFANRFRPEADIAAESSAFETRKRFANEILQVNAEIRKHEEKAAELRTIGAETEAQREERQIALLSARKLKLEEVTEVQARLNAEQIRGIKEAERTFEFGWRSAFDQYEKDAANSAQHARSIFQTATDAMSAGFANFVKTGKVNFSDFARSVIGKLIDIQAQSTASGIMSFGMGLLGLGRGGSAATSAPAALDYNPMAPTNLFSTAHTGGIVGLLTAIKAVPSSLFLGASRMHTGGLVGGEVPIIAKRGEGVFTPEQMRALAPAGGVRGGDQFHINVQVNAETGEAKVSGDNRPDMKQLAEIIAAGARQEIVKQQRPGGLLPRK